MLSVVRVEPKVIVVAEGRAEIWSPRRDVVLTRLEGRMVMDHAHAVMQAVDTAIEANGGQVTAIHDWTEVVSYQVAVQASMSAWGMKVAGSMRRVVIGVVSPLVALGVRTANLAANDRFEVVRDRESVEAAVRDLLERSS